MKPIPLEQLLLLEQSGELSPEQQHQLDTELAASPEARQQREALRFIAGAIPPVEAEPAPDAAARIAARLQAAPTPSRRSLFHPVWKPALAAAAALAILFGVRTWRTPDTGSIETAQIELTEEEEAWLSPFEADFMEIENLLAAMDSDDSMELTEL